MYFPEFYHYLLYSNIFSVFEYDIVLVSVAYIDAVYVVRTPVVPFRDRCGYTLSICT